MTINVEENFIQRVIAEKVMYQKMYCEKADELLLYKKIVKNNTGDHSNKTILIDQKQRSDLSFLDLKKALNDLNCLLEQKDKEILKFKQYYIESNQRFNAVELSKRLIQQRNQKLQQENKSLHAQIQQIRSERLRFNNESNRLSNITSENNIYSQFFQIGRELQIQNLQDASGYFRNSSNFN